MCVGQGANLTYEDFPVFGPKAIAGIGKLPDTISDRAIKIELRRRTRSEPVERFRLRKVEPEVAPLTAGAAAWAEAHVERLEGLEPELPDELDDRAQEICEPLLAVAEAAGDNWPERARRAVIALAGASAREDSDSLGIRLLRNVRSASTRRRPTGSRPTICSKPCMLWRRPLGGRCAGSLWTQGPWPACSSPTTSSQKSSARESTPSGDTGERA